jgi:GDP-L-fucose synthase
VAQAFDIRGARVWVAGHRGMAGSAIARRLAREPVSVLTVDRRELDLRDAAAVDAWMAANRPDVVVLAAAKVGGIAANDRLPADFIYDNLAIELAVIGSAGAHGVRKLLFLGSSCVYPVIPDRPITEDDLLTGPLEPTNQWYATAKIAGVKLCQAFRRQYGADFVSVMPTNLYGPGDTYDPEMSHAPAALIRRLDQAKRAGAPNVTVWGTGRPRREFLYVDDLADACVHVLERYSEEAPLNIGVGEDLTIAEFAAVVAEVVGYDGAFVFDASRPDGVARKLLDVSRIHALGWRARTPLREGLALAYADYLARRDAGLIGD